jgi:riboflavin kinase/FMN adenylyltransferase
VVLTLGKFDGVHAGHRHVVAQLRAEAHARGVASAVLVLHPNPVTVLFGHRVPILTTGEERCKRLIELGVDIADALVFDRELAALDPAEFLDRLAERFDLQAIVAGPDFAFGRDRAGRIDTLRALGKARGFEVLVVEPLLVAGERVGSRRVKQLIEAGEIAAARELLAAPPQLTGTVVHGAHRGRELGFPTANLALTDDFVVPGDGIYTVRARWEEAISTRGSQGDGWHGSGWHDGVAAIGVRPTFDNGPRSIEVFLLDWSGDLYGQQMTVEFLAWQRGEERFDSVDALVVQMHADVAVARGKLKEEAVS